MVVTKKMKNALILHGAGNNSSGNWFPWLKGELEKKGYKVWAPDLPDWDKPDKNKGINAVFSNTDWEFNEESIIIGHSAGATLILRILEALPEYVKINKAILVAGFADMGKIPAAFKYKKGLLVEPFKWKKIKSACEEFVFIASDNDHYSCGEEQARAFHESLGGDLIIKKGQEHFNLEAGEKYRQFPEILEYIG